jgi:hypothetical protein
VLVELIAGEVGKGLQSRRKTAGKIPPDLLCPICCFDIPSRAALVGGEQKPASFQRNKRLISRANSANAGCDFGLMNNQSASSKSLLGCTDRENLATEPANL